MLFTPLACPMKIICSKTLLDSFSNLLLSSSLTTNIRTLFLCIIIYYFAFYLTSIFCGWWVSHNNGNNKSDKNNLNLKHNVKSCGFHVQDIPSHVNFIFDLNKLCGDISSKCIYKCESKSFQMENNFPTQNSLVSTACKQFFYYVTPTVSACLDCHLANVT